MKMSEATEFKRPKIVDISNDNKSVPVQNNGIIESDEKGGAIMSQDNYSKNEIDLKFENLEMKVDSKFDLLMQKMDDGFEKQSLRTENLLLNFKEDLNKEQKENKRWLIGISVGSLLSIIGIIISIITIITQK